MRRMAASTRIEAPTGMSAWLVRAMLLVAALFLFWWAQGAGDELQLTSRAYFRLDGADLAGSVVLFVLAGLAFGLATRFPFPEPRFAWGRLAFAILALVPAVHFWFLLSGTADGVLGRFFWFDGFVTVQIGAVLAGVSIASGVGARR
jgi:hypothetical protein